MTVYSPSKRPRAVNTSPPASRLPLPTSSRLPFALLFSLLSLIAPGSNLHAQGRARNAGPQWTDSTGESDVYPVGDAVGVYRAVLDQLYVDGDDRPPYILLWDTATRQAIGPCTWNPCTDKWPHKSQIDSATILAYARPSLKRPRIVDFGYKIRIRRVNTNEFERIRQDGYAVLANVPPEKVGPQEAFWAGFRKKHPKAWGYAMLSKVAFNPEHSQALIGVFLNCGEGCRSTEEMFLRRIGNQWKVVERILEEGETYRTSGTERYRGPRVQKPRESEVLVADSSSDNNTRGEADDAVNVYRTVLDKLYTFQGESPGRVVIMDTYTGNGGELPQHRSKIDSTTLASYVFLGQVHEAMNHRFTYRISVTWLNEDALKQLDREGQPLVKRAEEMMLDEQLPAWLAFNSRYPDAWGYVRLGRVAFNPAHTQSLVTTRHFCGQQCINTDTWFLERKGDVWYVVERMTGENSPYWGLDGLRYLGPDVDPRSYNPRRVKGILSDMDTGAPLPDTEIEIARPGQSSLFVKTDKQGRYVLDKLARTPLTLKVKCRPPSQEKIVVGAIAVTPGLDSTVNANVDFLSCSQH